MEQVFCKAADSFRAGKLVECRSHLLKVQVQLQGFSRLQWYLDCNLLTCRLRELLRGGGRKDEVQEVLLDCERLWQKISGLAPSRCSVGVELAVVLALCQLHTLLSHWEQLRPLISSLLHRVRQVTSPSSSSSSLSTSLDTVDVQSFGVVAVKCMSKLRVMYALGEVGRGEEKGEKVIAAHSQWLGGDQTETLYRRAWEQFKKKDYQSSLLTLSSPPLSPLPLALSPLVHLLCGACHAKLAHPQLALLHWKRCIEIGHTPDHTPFLAALQNSALSYSEAPAATAARRLEIEVFSLSLSLLICCSGSEMQAWSLARGQRYEEASLALGECLREVEGGASVREGDSVLPQPSSLHLLQASCQVASGGEEFRRGKNVCKNLLQLSSPANKLWRSKVMCVLATACLCVGECGECEEWGLRCLGAVEEMVRDGDSLTHSQLHQLQVHTQLLLALVAIAHAHWREALQLLASLLDTPTGLYNYCLLQCRVGVVMGGASGWLEKRSKMPRERSEARERLRESQQLLSLATSGCEREYAAMDVAMLKLWLQHNR